MKFSVEYTMDGVGYMRTIMAKSKENAMSQLVDELKEAYPLSVCDIKVVEEVAEVVENGGKKVKRGKI